MREETHWITHLKQWGVPLHMALDVLEPLGPLGAQVIWTLQPALGVFVHPDTLRQIAETLEDPDSLAALREQIDA